MVLVVKNFKIAHWAISQSSELGAQSRSGTVDNFYGSQNRTEGYCDAAWGNLSDGKTGGGIFICLAAVNPYGGNEMFCPVGCSSKRLRRVVRSTFAGETLIASEALDEVIYPADTWSELGGGKIGRIIRSDSKSLYDHVLLKGNCKEKRLNVEINALKEGLQQGELTRLEWVESQTQLADALTKHMQR